VAVSALWSETFRFELTRIVRIKSASKTLTWRCRHVFVWKMKDRTDKRVTCELRPTGQGSLELTFNCLSPKYLRLLKRHVLFAFLQLLKTTARWWRHQQLRHQAPMTETICSCFPLTSRRVRTGPAWRHRRTNPSTAKKVRVDLWPALIFNRQQGGEIAALNFPKNIYLFIFFSSIAKSRNIVKWYCGSLRAVQYYLCKSFQKELRCHRSVRRKWIRVSRFLFCGSLKLGFYDVRLRAGWPTLICSF